MKKIEKIILLTNAMTPYRKELYDYMYLFLKEKRIEFKVFCEVKKTRNWKYEEYQASYTKLLKGISFKYKDIEFPLNYTIRKELEKERPDILIIGGSWATPTNFLIDLKKYRVIFWHESNLLGIKRIDGVKAKLWDYFRQKFYQKITNYMIPGKNAEEAVREWRKTKEKINFINFPNTIEELKFCKKEIITYSEKKKMFLLPARLIKIKGIIEFIQGTKEIITKENVELIIAGEGELRCDIETLIKNNKLDNKIKLIGYINSQELKKYYEEADIFILPSLYDPSPLAAIEALYYNLPILVSNRIGNCPEVLDNNGYCFDPFDSQDMKAKFKKILKWSNKDYENASNNSKNIYFRNFNKNKIVDNLLKELNKIYIKLED